MPKLKNTHKFLIVLILFAISCYGFMMKLPVPLRGIDRELHAVYFFLAATFFNILFNVKKPDKHFLIFGMLFLFSTLIEFAQDFSNHYVGRIIHGRFDTEDLKYNLFGLILFTAIWLVYYVISLVRK